MSGEPAPISTAKRALVEKYLRTNVHARPNAEFRVPRRAAGSEVPLSFAQEQVWLHAQLAPELPLYNEPVTIHYDGPLNIEAFENAFNEIIRCHEAWRTSFTAVDGLPVQIVHPYVPVHIPVIDLTHIPAEKRDAEAIRIATIDAVKPLDFSRW